MIDLYLQPNEIAFYIDIELVKGFTLTETFNKLVELKYQPEMTYYWSHNNTKLNSCALLYRKVEDDPWTRYFELSPKWDELADIFGFEAIKIDLNDNPCVV